MKRDDFLFSKPNQVHPSMLRFRAPSKTTHPSVHPTLQARGHGTKGSHGRAHRAVERAPLTRRCRRTGSELGRKGTGEKWGAWGKHSNISQDPGPGLGRPHLVWADRRFPFNLEQLSVSNLFQVLLTAWPWNGLLSWRQTIFPPQIFNTLYFY